MFVTLEGGDFTGKSTLATTLTSVLRKTGFEVMPTREPGGGNDGSKYREFIKTRLANGATPVELAMLMSADRNAHLHEVILPNLNKVVLSDRYVDSMVVYQGFEGNVPFEIIKQLCEIIGVRWPDLTFLLYFPEKKFQRVIQARMEIANEEGGRRMDAFKAWDDASLQTHRLRQQHYLSLPKFYSSWGIRRFFVSVDASQNPFNIVRQTLEAINPFLSGVDKQRRRPAVRLADLLESLKSYSSEGNMDELMRRYQRQIAFRESWK